MFFSLTFGFLLTGFLIQKNENEAPVVNIIKPQKNESFSWNTPLYYSLQVNDREDGTTEYQEITPQEIFLKAVYVPVPPKQVKEQTLHFSVSEQTTLVQMARANCFSCHQPERKIIGPSWRAISEKYNPTTETVELLTKKVKQGTTGTWSNEKMPSHPDLPESSIRELVKWILQYRQYKQVQFYIGQEGVINTGSNPFPGQNTQLILTAIYTDHGVTGSLTSMKSGSHSIVLPTSK